MDHLFFAESGYCIPGGLYFADSDNIASFYSYGVWIREVTLPREDPNFQMVQDVGGKWRANKIVVGPRHSLAGPYTYTRLGVPVMKLDEASGRGYINILKWWKASSPAKELEFEYTADALDLASASGHIHVLDWLQQSDLSLKYSIRAMDVASKHGLVEVLIWWKASGVELRYSGNAMNSATSFGHVAVLDWWKASGLKLMYSERALQWAIYSDYVAVIDWWKVTGLPLEYPEKSQRVDNRCNDSIEIPIHVYYVQ